MVFRDLIFLRQFWLTPSPQFGTCLDNHFDPCDLFLTSSENLWGLSDYVAILISKINMHLRNALSLNFTHFNVETFQVWCMHVFVACVCGCMCVACVCGCVCVFVSLSVCLYVHVCMMCVCLSVCLSLCLSVCLCVLVCMMCVCMCVCVCVCAQFCMWTQLIVPPIYSLAILNWPRFFPCPISETKGLVTHWEIGQFSVDTSAYFYVNQIYRKQNWTRTPWRKLKRFGHLRKIWKISDITL